MPTELLSDIQTASNRPSSGPAISTPFHSTPPTRNMNIYASACALALLLLLALCSQTFSAPVGADPPTSCCFSYTSKKIPRNLLTSYYETSSKCTQPGVVFITKKKREICADPSVKWVQIYMADLGRN